MRDTAARARAYFGFLIGHRRLLAFGLLGAMLSGFGQTFYVGLFNAELRATFSLSHGQFGLVYGLATLGSAGALILIGRMYDRVDLKTFLVAAAVILAGGSALLAGSTALPGLAAALLLLRLGGQGMMGHIAITTMARRFHGGRGKAVSVAAMGYPLAEATFPLVAVALLGVLGWRGVWWCGIVAVLALFLPVLLWLLKGAGNGEAPPDDSHRRIGADWRLGEVIRDRRFYMIAPAAVAGPFVVTLAFLHQVPMAQSKGWSLELVASGLSLFALGHVLGLLFGGPLVDRWSAKRVLPPAMIPMIMAMVVLAAFDQAWAALLWPALLGTTLGLAGTSGSSLLAELYGVAHLGVIRSLMQAIMILATAVGPAAAGWLLDAGVGAETIAIGLAAGVTGAAITAWRALNRTTRLPGATAGR